jgi:hypothetical protein
VSFDALSWAAKQRPGSSGAKLVLLGLAECASRGDARAFPSLAELVDFSSLDRKSVIANLDKLEAAGLITDTGERVGRTKQIKVYVLNLQSIPKAEPSQKRNSPVISAKGPKNGTRNKSEPSSEAKASSQRGSRIPLDWKPGALPQTVAALMAQWPRDRYERELEGFLDYWTTRPSGATKLDWDKTWHNRIRDMHDRIMRDARFAKTGPEPIKSSKRLTVRDLQCMIAFAEDHGDPERAAELRQKLRELQPPADPNVARLVGQATRGLRATA